jgi:hypothetical protein
MERPPELLKSLANQLAESAVSKDTAEVIRMLRVMGLFFRSSNHAPNQLPSDPVNDHPGPTPNLNRVGIWERKLKDGRSSFVRRMDMRGEWNYWANIGRIDPKRGQRRVVLMGESVARGYFYDPQFTPAMALEGVLRRSLGQGEFEVVDLARTSLEMEGLLELAMSAIALEPDAIVIFAGNNWGLTFTNDARILSDPEIQLAISAILREQGVPGLKRYFEERLANDVGRLVKEIASLYGAKGIPVVWIVPEFNLVDWRDAETNAPYLVGETNRGWAVHREAALDALREGNLSKAADSAARMVELDKGVCVTGLYILAECKRRSGDQDSARRCLEMARDALIWDPSRMVSPRAYLIEQETLRNEVSKYGNGLVDLPRLFKEYLAGELPDRKLFLDYCHLTSQAIRIAMAATASRLIKMLKGVDIPWSALADEMVGPEREVEGEAAFLAAIHNAHWWQTDELVQYYCLQAVEAAPKIIQVMANFIDSQTRNAPMLMCRSAEQIAAVGSPLIQQYLLRHNRQYLDPYLLDAVVDSLKRLQIDVRDHLDRLRLEEHSVTRRDVDLLDLYYCFASKQPQELRWVLNDRVRTELDVDYFKAYGVESRFIFVSEANCHARLSLTCRLPSKTEGIVSIEVSGKRIAEIAVTRSWKTWDITVVGELVREGINEIVIRWPNAEFSSEKALEEVAQDILQGAYPSLFPVFGEIHRFVASGRASYS